MNSVKLRMPRWVEGILIVAISASAFGHQDPWGDIYPQVQVMDGNFAIVFTSSRQNDLEDYGESKSVQRMIYSPEGKLVAPRHPLEKRRSWRETGPVGLHGRQIPFGDSTVIFQGRSSKPGYMVRSTQGKLMRVRLPWPNETHLSLFEDAMLTDDGVAITGVEETANLKFYWFEHESTKPPAVQVIGATATIYHFPVASNVAYAGGRFWVALMQPDETEGWKLALWSWKPGEAKGRMEVLDSLAHWNCHLSLAAIGDRLCLAYHCDLLESYNESEARIVTLFREAK